jgi:hypothetical protein
MNTLCHYPGTTPYRYALDDVRGNLGCIVVCDGHPDAPNIDIGVRILALSALQTVYKNMDKPLDYTAFGTASLDLAKEALDQFSKLTLECLRSTLLVAWVNQGQMTAYLYGDGTFQHCVGDSVHDLAVRFLSASGWAEPDYLFLNLDPYLKNQYLNRMYTTSVSNSIARLTAHETSGEVSNCCPFDKIEIHAPLLPGDSIVLRTTSSGTRLSEDAKASLSL